MLSLKEEVVLGAFLHDIGKILSRMSENKHSHLKEGEDFLKRIKPVSLYARYHHLSKGIKLDEFKEKLKKIKGIEDPDELEKEAEKLLKRIFIVSKADNIAAGERQPVDEDNKFDINTPLLSIFSKVNLKKDSSNKVEDKYIASVFSESVSEIAIPVLDKINAETNYRKFFKAFGEFAPNLSVSLWDIALLNLARFVPAMLSKREAISLYDHMKVTAAVALSLYLYYKDKIEDENVSYNDFTDYYEKSILKERPLLLVEGDLSGIQKFVYSVTQKKKALKNIKGRSLYLELLMIDVIQEILKRSGVYSQNVILASGGNFWLILPNLPEVKTKIDNVFRQANKFLFNRFKGRLFLGIGYLPIEAKPYKGKEFTDLFKNLSEEVSKKKKARFKEIINGEEDFYLNIFSKENKLCNACKVSTVSKGKKDGVCDVCDEMISLGNKFLREGRSLYAIWQTEDGDGEFYTFPFSNLKLDSRVKIDDLESARGITLINIYDKPSKVIKLLKEIDKVARRENKLINIYYSSWYISHSRNNFEEFGKKAVGNRKIGVLKADVDSLGDIFKYGLDENYRTFSGLATLSRNIELFFKIYLNFLAQPDKLMDKLNVAVGDYKKEVKNKIYEKVELWKLTHKEDKNYNIAIIYAGGDDLVVVGSWNDVVAFAVSLDKFFKKYTGNEENIHLSAGISVVNPKYPFYDAVAKAEEFLDEAKNKLEGKNGISINNILPYKLDKFKKIINNFSGLFDNGKNELKLKDYISKAFLYKVLSFERMYYKKNKDLQIIVYLHYLLARQGEKKSQKILESLGEYFELSRKGDNVYPEKLKYFEYGVWLVSYLTRDR